LSVLEKLEINLGQSYFIQREKILFINYNETGFLIEKFVLSKNIINYFLSSKKVFFNELNKYLFKFAYQLEYCSKVVK